MRTRFFVAGLVAGFLLVPVAVYLYVSFGPVPVSTFDPELPFETSIARIATRARMSREMPKSSPVVPDENNLAAGAHVYAADCAMCHGLPGGRVPSIAAGMYPPPPQLFHGKGVTEDPVGESYWKVENGLRLTGMPGFKQTLSPEQMWQVSLLVSRADKLPAAARAALTEATSRKVP